MRVILASPEAKVWSERKHIPLGLGYLAAVLREGGHEVMIYDAAIEDVGVEYYLDQAEAQGKPYDLIGITATTPLIQDAWEMAQLGKQRGLTTVLGGPHLTIMPLESHAAAAHRLCGLCLQGRGRVLVPGTGQYAGSGRKPELMPGIHFRRGDEIVASPESPMIPDLDALPFPAHDLFKIDRYTNLQPLTDGLDRARAQLYDSDQPRLPVQVHLLLQAGHRRHLAGALGGERGRTNGSGWSRAWARPRSA